MIEEIRLGWLQRLCAVAKHGSYVQAGEECGADSTCIADSVQSLEKALGRLLVYPTTAKLSATGRVFLPTAQNIYSLLEAFNPNMSNIKVGWFKTLISLSETGNYVQASKALTQSRYKTMRQIQHLRHWVGKDLFYPQGHSVNTTEIGNDLISVSMGIISMLEKWHDPNNNPYAIKRNRRIPPWYLRHIKI